MSSMPCRKKSRPASACLYSLVFGLALLLGAETAGAQIRTVLVSPVPGDPLASGNALRNALAGISSPSSTNRWLLKVEPGIYDVGTTSLQMRSWVDIEGSGIGVTTIRGSVTTFYNATIHGASNAELRLLTVEASGNVGNFAPGPIAMANYNGASPRLYRVKFSTTGGAQIIWGLRNVDSTPLIEECEISVTNTGADTSYSYGLAFRNDSCSLPAGRSSILRTKIAVSSAGTNNGVALANAQFVSDIRDSQIQAIGGKTTYGIYANSDGCGWLGSESLQVRNTEISSWGGSSASYGIDIQAPSSINLEINGSRVWGHVSPTSYGIRQGGPGSVVPQWSHIVGFTQTVKASGSASLQSTYLQGGPVTADGWLGCMGVWDENGVFYAQACP